jgi:hypothetical protein
MSGKISSPATHDNVKVQAYQGRSSRHTSLAEGSGLILPVSQKGMSMRLGICDLAGHQRDLPL